MHGHTSPLKSDCNLDLGSLSFSVIYLSLWGLDFNYLYTVGQYILLDGNIYFSYLIMFYDSATYRLRKF